MTNSALVIRVRPWVMADLEFSRTARFCMWSTILAALIGCQRARGILGGCWTRFTEMTLSARWALFVSWIHLDSSTAGQRQALASTSTSKVRDVKQVNRFQPINIINGWVLLTASYDDRPGVEWWLAVDGDNSGDVLRFRSAESATAYAQTHHPDGPKHER